MSCYLYNPRTQSRAGIWNSVPVNHIANVSDRGNRDSEHSRSSSQASDRSSCRSTSSSTATTVSLPDGESDQDLMKTVENPTSFPMSLEAALQGNLNRPQLQDRVVTEVRQQDQENVVHISARTEGIPLLQGLTSSGSTCSVNSQTISPLEYAALNNHLESVQYLVATETFRCLPAERKIEMLGRAHEFAEHEGHNRLANYLSTKCKAVQRTQYLRLLQTAVLNNDTDLVEKLAPDNINKVVTLNMASARGQGELVMSLLNGMETESARKEGARNAYLSSLDSGSVEVGQRLVLHGEVDIDFAVVTAAQHKHRELFQWLMEVDGDIA